MNLARMAAKEAVRDAQDSYQRNEHKQGKSADNRSGNSGIEDIDYEELN